MGKILQRKRIHCSQLTIDTLIAIPSPRDIDVVLDGHQEIRDTYHAPFLYVKYWAEIQAYTIIQDFFLNRSSAKYLVIAPDDLIVTKEHYEALTKTLEETDYPIFSGICNLDCAHPAILNICIDEIPDIIRRLRRYKWGMLGKVPEGIIQVKFAGFPFMFIRRDIVKQIPFQGDTPYDPIRRGKEPRAFDIAFCWECHQRNIPIMVDTRIKLLHLKDMQYHTLTGSQVNNIKVFKEKPKVYYETDSQIEDLTDYYLNRMNELNPYDTKSYLKPYIK